MCDEDHDTAVRDTAFDSASCKLSAVGKGYFDDPFIRYFVKYPSNKMPIINRGYYARVAAFETIVNTFLNCNKTQRKQIVSLGAGNDTTYYKLKKKGVEALTFFEIDFPNITRQKINMIRRQEALMTAIGCSSKDSFNASLSPDKTELLCNGYHILSADLRDTVQLEKKIQMAGIDSTIPTLFLSECVLVYMQPNYSSNLISWISNYFRDPHLIVYEQIRPHDAFGRTMIANIKARGCELLSIEEYPELKSQEMRFVERGFLNTKAWDMNDIYYKLLNKEDLERTEKLELFDEVEEYHLLQAHYCLVVASKEDYLTSQIAKIIESKISSPTISIDKHRKWYLLLSVLFACIFFLLTKFIKI